MQVSASSPASFKSQRKIGIMTWLGIIVLAMVILSAIFAPLLSAYSPKDNACTPFSTPSPNHLLGCNDFGQDLWTHLLFGARTSLTVGLAVASLATVLATLLAIIAGYSAGGNEPSQSKAWLDRLIMRSVDVTLALPFLPLVIVLGVFFGASVQTQILVLSLVMWAQPVRELRAQILQLRHNGYVESAQTMGASAKFIGTRHILPDLLPLIVPQFIRIAHNAILVEATLSFLGLGDPLQSSWGSTLFHANARTAFLTGAWTYWILPPGLAIAITVLSFALIGYHFDSQLPIRLWRNKSSGQTSDLSPDTSQALLQLDQLSVDYDLSNGRFQALKAVNLTLHQGEMLGLVGESGSGKTTLGSAILNLLPERAHISGRRYYQGINLENLSPSAMRQLRQSAIAFIPQSAMNALNPVLSVGEQLDEVLRFEPNQSASQRQTSASYWLDKVGLSAKHLDFYPHQLSGGMRQRVVIAIALAKKPTLIIADEPTTGLDVLVQADILKLLIELKKEFNLTILFITHNLPLVLKFADSIAVMYQGEIVEQQATAQLRTQAQHWHTQSLLAGIPDLDNNKCLNPPIDTAQRPQTPILAFNNVSKAFYPPGIASMLRRKRDRQTVIDKLSFALYGGEIIGLVGGSGAGKSTITRLLLAMLQPDEGEVLFEQQNINHFNYEQKQALYRDVHLVYQDPYQSLNPRYSIFELVAEPLRIGKVSANKRLHPAVCQALKQVQLPHDDEFLRKTPNTLSGGQRQRVAFARALVTQPRLIIADEPTSMLDQSIRMDIINVMQQLKTQHNTGFLFITHDIALAHYFCQKIVVLHQGNIVEAGDVRTIVHQPQHPYTQALIHASL